MSVLDAPEHERYRGEPPRDVRRVLARGTLRFAYTDDNPFLSLARRAAQFVTEEFGKLFNTEMTAQFVRYVDRSAALKALRANRIDATLPELTAMELITAEMRNEEIEVLPACGTLALNISMSELKVCSVSFSHSLLDSQMLTCKFILLHITLLTDNVFYFILCLYY